MTVISEISNRQLYKQQQIDKLAEFIGELSPRKKDWAFRILNLLVAEINLLQRKNQKLLNGRPDVTDFQEIADKSIAMLSLIGVNYIDLDSFTADEFNWLCEHKGLMRELTAKNIIKTSQLLKAFHACHGRYPEGVDELKEFVT